MEILDGSLYEKSIRFSIEDIHTYRLDYEKGGVNVSRRHKFGEKEYTNEYIIRTERRAELNEKSEERLKQLKYRLVAHSEAFLVNKVRRSMSIENIDYTSILAIRLEDEIAVRAKMFLDTLSQVYINYSQRSDSLINARTLFHIGNQIDTLKVRLDTIETELEMYRKDSTILNLDKESDKFFEEWVKYDGDRRRFELQLQSINNLEKYMKNTKDHNLIPPSFYVLERDDFLEQSLQELYTKQIQKNRSEFDIRFQHAGMQQLDSTISTMKKDILLYIEDTRIAITQKIKDVTKQTNQYAGLMKRVPRRQRDMLSIERENQVNEKLYLFLLEKQANTQIARAGITPQMKIIERSRSIGKVGPNKERIYYIFILAGFILAGLITFIRYIYFDNIERVQDLKDITNLAVLGGIPVHKEIETQQLVIHSKPKSQITEAFRNLRTNLTYLNPDKEARVVLVTSVHPGEGKTFLSSNLASVLAKSEKRVLLIDLDLHKPKIQTTFNLTNEKGVSSFLIGKVEIKDIITKLPDMSLDVILSGPVPPNPSELILNEKLLELIQFTREEYDVVIVDTPPIGLISDAMVFLKQVDVGVFVMHTNMAKRQGVEFLEEIVKKSGVSSYGLVLNNIKTKKWRAYGGGYGMRYG